MKQTFYLIMFSIILVYCENQSKSIVNSDTDTVFGEWLVQGRSWTGKGFLAGDKKDTEIVKKFMDAYENMDPDLMVEMTIDTVKFHPADIQALLMLI